MFKACELLSCGTLKCNMKTVYNVYHHYDVDGDAYEDFLEEQAEETNAYFEEMEKKAEEERKSECKRITTELERCVALSEALCGVGKDRGLTLSQLAADIVLIGEGVFDTPCPEEVHLTSGGKLRTLWADCSYTMSLVHEGYTFEIRLSETQLALHFYPEKWPKSALPGYTNALLYELK